MPALYKKFEKFDLFQVSPHSYAAIKTHPDPMSNAGFIDLGGLIAIIDTFLSIDAALELKQAAVEICGHQNFVVVNTHGHSDHYIGNCVFPAGTLIFASQEARQEALGKQAQIKFGAEIYADQIQKMEACLAVTTDHDEKQNLENDLIFYRNYSDPAGRVVPPNATINSSLSLYGDRGPLELHRVEIAHSPGDVLCFLHEEQVAFVGDLLFTGEHPWIGSGDPFALRNHLQALLQSNIQWFIPGHGTLCGKEGVQELIDYLNAIIELVQNHKGEPEKLQPTDLPPVFHSYGGPCFRWNVDFLAKYRKI